MEEEQVEGGESGLPDAGLELEIQDESCELVDLQKEEAAPQEQGEATAYEAQEVAIVRHPDGEENYPSLYDTIPTTFGAILLGVSIIALIQMKVKHIFDTQKKDHKALTQFVTTMFALIVGIWIADKLIAGPDTELLAESESRDVLNFIKDTTLMVFAYYFGTKAQVPTDEAE